MTIHQIKIKEVIKSNHLLYFFLSKILYDPFRFIVSFVYIQFSCNIEGNTSYYIKYGEPAPEYWRHDRGAVMLRVEAEARKECFMAFVNFSNHVSSKWGVEQLNAAKEYGDIIDVQFPVVNPAATKEEIQEMAEKSSQEILEQHPTVVMAQGEFTLTFAVVRKLQEKGVKCVVACTRRRTDEEIQRLAAQGLTREGMFAFMGFREY